MQVSKARQAIGGAEAPLSYSRLQRGRESARYARSHQHYAACNMATGAGGGSRKTSKRTETREPELNKGMFDWEGVGCYTNYGHNQSREAQLCRWRLRMRSTTQGEEFPMSNLRGRSVSGELSLELESSGLCSDNSKLHCKETHAVTGKTPMLAEGRFPMPADAAGMFLLCVYPLGGRKGFSIEPGNGWQEVELALSNAEPAYFQERELPRLTPTETEVMDRLAQGKTNRVIAKEMFISINTVKTHVRSIFQKLGVNTRASAVRLATAAGLLDHWLPPPSP